MAGPQCGGSQVKMYESREQSGSPPQSSPPSSPSAPPPLPPECLKLVLRREKKVDEEKVLLETDLTSERSLVVVVFPWLRLCLTHTHTHGEPENSLTTVYTVCVCGGGGLGQSFFHQPEVVPVPVSERRPTESHVDVRSVIGQTRCS